ncbi:MAG: ROK family protein [Terracidiphilus sp.]
MTNVLAYDIGGSHATAGIVDYGSLAVICVRSRPIDSSGPANSILDELHALGEGVIAEARQLGVTTRGIGVAMPGPFDYEHGISLLQHKYASLYRMDLRRELGNRFGIAESTIVFLNDAQAFLLGECHAGAAKNLRRCIGLTLGTGVGSAFSMDGDIVENGPAVPPGGEIYCLPWTGGTVEDTISTRAIQKRYRELSGESRTVKEICMAAQHDCNAALAMREFGGSLGLVVQDLCMAFRPDAIVLGGEISRSADLFVLSAAASAGNGTGDLFRVSELFNDAPLVGAAVRCLKLCGVQALGALDRNDAGDLPEQSKNSDTVKEG